MAGQAPIEKTEAIGRVLINLHDIDEELADGLLLQAVDGPIPVLVGDDEAQGGVEVIANVVAPARDKALDNGTAGFEGREVVGAVRAVLCSARSSWASGTLLVLIEGVKERGEEDMEGPGFVEVVRAVWVSGGVRAGRRPWEAHSLLIELLLAQGAMAILAVVVLNGVLVGVRRHRHA